MACLPHKTSSCQNANVLKPNRFTTLSISSYPLSEEICAKSPVPAAVVHMSPPSGAGSVATSLRRLQCRALSPEPFGSVAAWVPRHSTTRPCALYLSSVCDSGGNEFFYRHLQSSFKGFLVGFIAPYMLVTILASNLLSISRVPVLLLLVLRVTSTVSHSAASDQLEVHNCAVVWLTLDSQSFQISVPLKFIQTHIDCTMHWFYVLLLCCAVIHIWKNQEKLTPKKNYNI